MIKHMMLGAALGALASTVSTADVQLCHIANAGFLAKGKNAAVLFDAARITDAYGGDYRLPSPGLMDQMIGGSGPFETVKLAFVSHRHNDHFDAAATLKHLRGDGDVIYLMPPEAFDLLKAEGLTAGEESRAHSVLPDWDGPPIRRRFGDILVEAYRVDHGEGSPQNIGFRVTFDGVSFFHTGDMVATGESLKRAGFNRTPVDVMLNVFWYGFGNEAQQQALASAFEIGTMVPMHIPPKEEAWMARYGGYEAVLKSLYETWPNAVELKEEMACTKVGPAN